MKIAFASCMDATRVPSQPVWDRIGLDAPDVLLLLGDQIYMDWGDLGESNWKQSIASKGQPALAAFAAEMHSRYERQWLVPQFQRLISGFIAQRGAQNLRVMWDDHDFAWNNSLGGVPEADVGITKHAVPQGVKAVSRRLFDQFVAHLKDPARPSDYPALPDNLLGSPVPIVGVETFGKVGNANDSIDCALLDTRWYRESRAHVSPRLLGPESGGQMSQLQQLFGSGKTGLLVIASGCPIKYKYRLSDQSWLSQKLATGEQQFADFDQLFTLANASSRPVLFLTGDVHRNVWSGPIRKVAAGSTKIVQVISSGAAIGNIGPKKVTPNYGLVSIEKGVPNAQGVIPDVCSIKLFSLRGPNEQTDWQQEPTTVPTLRFNQPKVTEASDWAELPDGEDAATVPFIDRSLSDLEPIELFVMRQSSLTDTSQMVTANLDDLDPIEAPFKMKLLPPNVMPSVVTVKVTPASDTVDSKLNLKYLAGFPTDQTAVALARIHAAFSRARAKAMDQRKVVLYVHGTGKTMPDLIDQCYALRALFDCEPIGFAWPSGSGGGGIAVLFGAVDAFATSSNSEQGLRWLLRQFNEVARQYPDVTATLLCRSAGCQAFVAALQTVTADPASRYEHFGAFNRIVLSSPLADVDLFRQAVNAGHLPPIAVMQNQYDQTLGFARWAIGKTTVLGKLLSEPQNHAYPGVQFLNYVSVGSLHDYLFPQISNGQRRVNQALFNRASIVADPANGIELMPGFSAQTFEIS